MAEIPCDDAKPGKFSIAGQMLRGSAWMIAMRWAIRLTGFVNTLVLVRILAPSDFGIVAMAMTFIGLLDVLNQTGQKLAIIRNPAPTRAHYDTAWTISVLAGLAIGALTLTIAPAAGLYFHEPRATLVMQWLALRSVMNGFENIGITDFRRDLRFDMFFLYNVIAKVVSVVVTLTLAVVLQNYWALVLSMLIGQAVIVVISYVMHPYRPRFSLAKAHEIWIFSGWTLFKSVGQYLNNQVDLIAVGGAFGTSAMGRYTVAHDMAATPSLEINDPMVAVLYPVMSRHQGDPATLRQLYLKTLSWSAIICASTSVGVALVAHDFVTILLGSKWLEVEPLIAMLALSAGVLGLCSSAYTPFDVLGKPHIGARMQWVRLILLAVAIAPVAMMARDTWPIAAARLAMTILFLPTLLLAVGRELGLHPQDYLRALWRPFTSALAMVAVVYPLVISLSPGLARLCVTATAGAVAFIAASIALWRISGSPDAPEAELVRVIRTSASYLQRLMRPVARLSSGN